MPFVVELDRDKAQKDLEDTDPPIRLRIVEKLRILEENPFPDGKTKKKLKGHEKLYELKISDWRAVYSIEGQKVIVKRIIHRRELHRSLRKL